MDNSLIEVFLILWFFLTALIICFWMIGNIIHDRKTKSGFLPNISTKRKNFIRYLLIFAFSGIFLYGFLTLIDIFLISSIIDKQILREALLAIGGGTLGAICYACLEKVK
jgi:hypothetical protein